MDQQSDKQGKVKLQAKAPRTKILVALYILFSVSILALIGIFISDIVKGRQMDHELSETVKKFKKQVKPVTNETPIINEDSNMAEEPQQPNVIQPEVIKTDGYTVLGIISVPSRGIEYPILKENTAEALKVSVCQIAGGELNTGVNVCLAGHNMRNGRLFAQIRYLKNGSIITITDRSGNKLTYKVFNKFKVDPKDVSVLEQNADGRKIISLITCTDDGNERLIVQAESVNQ